jgi:hypothetical protein
MSIDSNAISLADKISLPAGIPEQKCQCLERRCSCDESLAAALSHDMGPAPRREDDKQHSPQRTPDVKDISIFLSPNQEMSPEEKLGKLIFRSVLSDALFRV